MTLSKRFSASDAMNAPCANERGDIHQNHMKNKGLERHFLARQKIWRPLKSRGWAARASQIWSSVKVIKYFIV
jgi:hypothetical protein